MVCFKMRQCFLALVCFSLLASISACGNTTNASVVHHGDGPVISSTPPPTPSPTPIPLDQQSVYVASVSGMVSKLNASTGSIRWKYHSQGTLNLVSGTDNGSLLTPITLSDGVLYIASSVGIEAVNITDGSMLWQSKTGGAIIRPLISNGVIYINGTKGLLALNAKDGKMLWSQPEPSNCWPVAVFDGVVYIEWGTNNQFKAFNALDGQPLWQQELTPWFWGGTDGVIYFTDLRSGGIIALNAHNGAQLWQSNQTPFGLSHNTIYTISNDHYVYALNTTNDSVIWKSKESFFWHASPELVDGVIYVSTSENAIAALNADNGSLIWASSALHGNVYLNGGGNGVLYVFYFENNLYNAGKIAALNMNNGTLAWNTQISYTTELLSLAGVTNGVACLTSNDIGVDNSIVLFNTGDGSQRWHYSSVGQFPGAILG